MNIPTCKHPDDPSKFYIRMWFREWFYGPFENAEAVGQAMTHLDATDEHWDYDGLSVVRGANPLPTDYVYGFPDITDADVKTIIGIRSGNAQRCHVYQRGRRCDLQADHAGEHDYTIGV